MGSIVGGIKNIVVKNPSGDDTKTPLHVGEVMNLWLYMTMLHEINRFVEVGLNTTTDKELIASLQRSYDNCANHISEVKTLFKKEGISLPPVSEEKPKSDPADVPPGVKLTDDELANGISIKSVTAINLCATGLTQAIRTDIGAMWIKFLNSRITVSAQLRELMKKRGWLKIPPVYYPPGS